LFIWCGELSCVHLPAFYCMLNTHCRIVSYRTLHCKSGYGDV